MSFPYIVLNGGPNSGKSTLATILERRYGFIMIDDGAPLREACIDLYGLTPWHVYTQEGKESQVEICGQPVQVRQLLGGLRKLLDGVHGPDWLPEAAIKKAALDHPHFTGSFVFGSVRNSQASVYKRAGGLVIELQASGCDPVNEFDMWDKSLVDMSIFNHKVGRNHFADVVAAHLDPIFEPLRCELQIFPGED